MIDIKLEILTDEPKQKRCWVLKRYKPISRIYENSTKLQVHIKWTGAWDQGIWEEKEEEILVESSREEESPCPAGEGVWYPWRQGGPSAGPL